MKSGECEKTNTESTWLQPGKGDWCRLPGYVSIIRKAKFRLVSDGLGGPGVMFERFTDRARRVVVLAQEEARMLNHNYIGTEHILLGLIHEGEGVAWKALESLGISLEAVRQQVEQRAEAAAAQGQPAPSAHIPFTLRAKKVLELSLREALQFGHNYIGTEHILLGLLRENDDETAEILAGLGADQDRVREQVVELLHRYQAGEPEPAESAPSTPLVLDQFGRNLTAAAREGKLDPVIGRDKEIERVMQVLSRRTKNNPVLVGEPGVDKIAVVEGLAQKIIQGEVPGPIEDKQLYTLDLDALIIESRYGGEAPDQFKETIDEIRRHSEIILFVNNLHMIIGAGSEGVVADARAVLEPMIAREQLQIIGATTLDEYRKYLERDPVLGQRFQSVEVGEPTVPHTIELLKGLRDRYEAHHRVSITDGALVASAQLADRYISDRFLPDKAIDVIDEAAAEVRVGRIAGPPDLREYDEKIAQVRREKESAINSNDFEKAAALRDSEKQLLAKKATREKEWKADGPHVIAEVNEDSILAAVSVITGIPEQRLRELESQSHGDQETRSPSSADYQSYKLLNDQPVSGEKDDLLGAAGTAAGIADMLASSRGESPFVMAIDGAGPRQEHPARSDQPGTQAALSGNPAD